ncbi:hypothetical protein [Desulfobacter vibrioformis]|uniref:hypothetical protein n=1 Tax=Desulfobacter vibrioformis TaxID=34031 RepID=UPI001B7FFF73|nr:hypothetical protein [Desulfobacter vibrioformis]
MDEKSPICALHLGNFSFKIEAIKLEALRARLAEGEAQLDKGQGVDGQSFMDELIGWHNSIYSFSRISCHFHGKSFNIIWVFIIEKMEFAFSSIQSDNISDGPFRIGTFQNFMPISVFLLSSIYHHFPYFLP